MAHRRYPDCDRGDFHVFLAAYPDLALLCETDISDEHIAAVVRSLLLLGLTNRTPEEPIGINQKSSALEPSCKRQMTLFDLTRLVLAALVQILLEYWVPGG